MNADLQRRYRRLLACYPPEYRRVYEEEMLGVLLAGAGPGQRYPGLREAADLLVAAVRMRVGRVGAGLTDPRWTDAVAVLGVLAAVLLLAKHLRPVAAELGWHLRFGDSLPFTASATQWLRIAVWAAVTVAVLVGWRIVAALGAWAAVLGEAVLLAVRQPAYPVTVLFASWPLLLAVIAATALSVATWAHRGTAVLGWRRTALVGTAGVVAATAPMVEPLLAIGDGGVIAIRVDHVALVARLTYATITVIVLAAIAGIAPPIRRRVLALLAPTVTLLAVINLGFDRAFSGAVYLRPILPAPSQWLVLATAPLLVFLASLYWVIRLAVRHGIEDAEQRRQRRGGQ